LVVGIVVITAAVVCELCIVVVDFVVEVPPPVLLPQSYLLSKNSQNKEKN